MSAYIEEQEKMDKEYVEGFESLTPAQWRKLEGKGVDGPKVSRSGGAPETTREGFTMPEEYQEAPEDEFAESVSHLIPRENMAAVKEAFTRFSGGVEKSDYADAFQIAGNLVHLCLQLLCRSKFPGLRRAADTLVLTISREIGGEDTQADLARKYGVTRAAINKDVREIQSNRAFGELTRFFFSKPETRALAVERAKDEHKKTKELATNPPENSMAALIRKHL